MSKHPDRVLTFLLKMLEWKYNINRTIMSGASPDLRQGVKDDPQECVEHGKQHPDIQPLYTRRGRQVVGHSNKTDQKWLTALSDIW